MGGLMCSMVLVSRDVAITFMPTFRKAVASASPRPPGLQPVMRAHFDDGDLGGVVMF